MVAPFSTPRVLEPTLMTGARNNRRLDTGFMGCSPINLLPSSNLTLSDMTGLLHEN